jgi:hypothetical protein
MIIFWGVMIFWHWRFGLAMSLLADGEHSLNWCIKRSWILTGRRKWWSLGWLLFDYGVILLSGIMIPVVGVVMGMSLVLTLTFWGQKILENN